MTNTLYKKMTVFSLVLMLGLMPALSYADNDNGKKKNKQNDRSERIEKNDDRDDDRDEDEDEDRDEDRKSEKREKKEKDRKNSDRKELCRTAFGRLFAPGFVNNWGAEEREFFWNCFVPFGIAKKFNGTTSSTTPSTDVTAPVISNLLAKPNTVKATITWNTNEKSDSAVFWGTSTGVTSSSTSLVKNEKVKEHKLVIEGLSASTTYYFVVRSKDASGNTSTSSESSFTTKPVSTDSSAPIISSVTLLMSTSTANISWHTNENATSRVYYGTSSGLDVNASTTSFVENTTLKQNHSILVSGLSTSTLYYFAAESRDGSGNRTVTPVFSATTSGL